MKTRGFYVRWGLVPIAALGAAFWLASANGANHKPKPGSSHNSNSTSCTVTITNGPSYVAGCLYTMVNGRRVYTNVCSISGAHVLKIDITGLTPGKKHQTIALYPLNSAYRGAEYTDYALGVVGTNSATGSAPTWQWDCAVGKGGHPDPLGAYPVTIIDRPTGKHWAGYIITVP